MEKPVSQLPSLKSLRVFEEVAQSGNVARAAEKLNITPSAASHQLAKLEKELGSILFHRSAKGVALTLAGERYLAEIRPLILSLTQATARLRNEKDRSALRIHCAPSFGLLWLLPRIHQFREAHPDIQVSLSCSYENLSFSRDNIDIAVRHGFPEWKAFEIKTIRHEKMSVLASPDYLDKYPLRSPDELNNHALILSESPLIQWPQWFATQQLPQPTQEWLFRFDRSYMSLEAAMLGHGLIFESELLAADYLRSGKLVRVFDDAMSLPVSAHHLVYPRGYAQFPRVSYFLQWIQAQLDA
ncbi:MAG: LysR substrate-binding domain-containing protein [Pantoea sp.]|jgi:DNA-binding transcriptional LysR family regulator|uniref:LysR substrate-binding domain-containing protein n=1 Tax=Pantoea TaxID=53335 RepID=UPI000660AAA6|nr:MULTISPECIES: LysR substrate-binding domain-containing protein [Pantoea]MBS6434970.1 LysR family transcriptional regulator [Pantoea sp.]MDU2728478.1 LysR substrate-binding domain-containing protein [Pantoea sp.]MDU5472766.1 LysR substrate-binding domain-containing protein [Pantoea sp.]MDU7837547.1 LysR substrate-binding domain-containing protein [Pantoea sp.]HAB23333.1 LysR family transcriptional regulator [Pantoea sp.]